MDTYLFNYQFHLASSWWERNSWLSHWWRIDRSDSRWIPPLYRLFKHELDPTYNNHLARLNPVYIYGEAMARTNQGPAISRGTEPGAPSFFVNPIVEGTVSAALALIDPRRSDQTAYLAYLKTVNNEDSLERLLEQLVLPLSELGIRRLIGPTGLSPYLDTGALTSGWNEIPPMHTPYHPPYLSELLESFLEPIETSRLYSLDLSNLDQQYIESLQIAPQVVLRPLNIFYLSKDLLPLLAALPSRAGSVAPDVPEAEFILRWLSPWPTAGWVAYRHGNPAGFILLQPDYAPVLRKSNGGRGLLGRARLFWERSRNTRLNGRLVLGGVLPEQRGQGVGTQLWRQAVQFGRAQGWGSLIAGPIPADHPADRFFLQRGVKPGQTFQLYQFEFS